MLRTVEMPADNPSRIKALTAALRTEDGLAEPLRQLPLYGFWRARFWLLLDDDAPLSIHVTRLGKRRTNRWEPYANWFVAYTVPEYRRRGHAAALYRVMEAEAYAVGCRRIKSLAGSSAGLGLHRSLEHDAWSLSENADVVIDSPFPWAAPHYARADVPPQAGADRPMTALEVSALIDRGLRYDAGSSTRPPVRLA